MWTIQRMDEMDDGDEERLPGEPMMTAVTLESDLGEILQFQMPHNWLLMQGLQEGEEWPEDIEEEDSEALKAREQAAWMKIIIMRCRNLRGKKSNVSMGQRDKSEFDEGG